MICEMVEAGRLGSDASTETERETKRGTGKGLERGSWIFFSRHTDSILKTPIS